MRWLIVLLLVLVSGCILPTTVKEKYVCPDAWLVDSPEGCSSHQIQTPKCPDCVCPTCETKVEYVYVNSTAPSTSTTLAVNDACAKLGCPAGTNYVASKSSTKYHLCACRSAKTIMPKNIVCYKTQQEAEAGKKQPCSICMG
ncbi:MAG: hypothetical protein V1744_06440 [Candidatus Altiarchaeota archaeon]